MLRILCVLTLALTSEALNADLRQAHANESSERLDLRGSIVVADGEQPSYVGHAVNELREYLEDVTGATVTVRPTAGPGVEPIIVIGSDVARRIPAEPALDANLGEEGFLIRSAFQEGRACVVVAGASPKGTKFGIYALMRMIRTNDTSAYIEVPVDVRSSPSFKLRGMHPNGWPIKYPYAFRKWREEDWKRYIDMLSYQGVNLFFLWPFMEIMPVPLSKEDEAYLQECRRIVDYAQTEHGMEVWLMQSANKIAKSDCAVSDPRERPYWRHDVQVNVDPANPEQFEAIMEAREALYRVVNNVDGICTIDADCGGWKDSPVSDYVKILKGCRSLLNEHNVHASRVKLISWLHFGWGNTSLQSESFEFPMNKIIREVQRDCPEPSMFVAGWLPILRMCNEEGVIAKTIVFPYSTIEGEPSYPATSVSVDTVRGILQGMDGFRDGAAGAMGNVQTPLLQFPHVYYYLSSLWDKDYETRTETAVLHDVSACLYPENQELVADCYAALKEHDPGKVDALAARLEGLVNENKLGRAGILGRKLFPDQSIVARSLVLQLRLKAAQERLFQSATGATNLEDYRKLLVACLDAYLSWDDAHGWTELWRTAWKWQWSPLYSAPRFSLVAVRIKQAAGGEEEYGRFLSGVAQDLSSKFDTERVRVVCLEPIKDVTRAAGPVSSLAQNAKAAASVEPNPELYPASQAVDGCLTTFFWPGGLGNNSEWIQLTWRQPESFSAVTVYFVQQSSMRGRTIHLQKEEPLGTWTDIATTVIPDDASAAHAVATFRLPAPELLVRIRIVNILHVCEIDVH